MTKRFFGPRIGSALVAGALFALTSLAGAAQQPQHGDQPPPDKADELSISSDLVVLDVSLVDRANRPVLDVTKDRFTVLEDNVAQPISFFSKEAAPVSVGLVIDSSGSMRTKLSSVVAAVSDIVRTNKPDDETAVIEFKDHADLLEEFTTNVRDVEDALGDLSPFGTTALLDAIKLSSDYVQKDGRHRRKALVVVTDGLEKGSYFTYDQVADQLKKQDVRVYLVGFTKDLDADGGVFKKSDKTKAEGLLNKLAEDTGGRAFFPADLSELKGIGEQIAADLRTSYSIGYYPTNDKKDGSFRKIQIKVAGDSKIVARTRLGYFAPKQ